MSEGNSIGPSPQIKPAKPTPNFPLFAHASGRWAKKIRGRLVYFGKWHDPDAALAKYLSEADDLHAGRSPSVDIAEGLTVRNLIGRFLTTKKAAMKAGELAERSFNDYVATCRRIEKSFGKSRLVSDLRPTDFERLRALIGRSWGPTTIANEINRVRVIFSYAFKGGLIDRPMVFGEGFRRPSAKVLRLHRHQQGPKMFEAAEIRRMIGTATQPLKTMILLAINCGFGNSDIGSLPLAAIDLTAGWVNYPRPKTGVARRCPLWPESIDALREWLGNRPEPKREADAGLVFVTRCGFSWNKDIADSPITKETRKLLDELEIAGKRNFYALRHTFQTIGDEARDFVAVRRIMGHAGGNDIADHYRERISDERLVAVTEHVRGWLFQAKAAKVG
jgi:integrase